MVIFTVLVIGLAYVFGQALGYGNSFIGIAVLLSVGSSFISYFFGDQIVLAMSGARHATRKKDFNFFTVTENLSLASGLPMPKLYVIEDTAINAFATGRDPKHAVLCLTSGLLMRLERREIEGVVAHELSHVENYDIRMMAIVAVLVGTVAYASDFFMRSLWWGGSAGGRSDRDSDRDNNGIFLVIGIVLAIVSPLIAMLIQMAISRKREYLADASGVLLTRYPEGLARALEKISKDKEVLEAATNATAHLFIANPFKGKQFGAWFAGLFDTHPPIEERIKILRAM
ncbi:TPA: zinc metalloprotease HtpX [Patescibacteria group bacterium]|nr:zinc metalloprotease HtpX [Patescibacteria group bacterium]